MHSLFRSLAHSPSSVTAAHVTSSPTTPHTTRFTNCRLLKNHELVSDCDLWVRGGVIVDPKVLFWEGASPDETVDCGGRILAPGLIELQVVPLAIHHLPALAHAHMYM